MASLTYGIFCMRSFCQSLYQNSVKFQKYFVSVLKKTPRNHKRGGGSITSIRCRNEEIKENSTSFFIHLELGNFVFKNIYHLILNQLLMKVKIC